MMTAQDHPIISFFNGSIFNDLILLNWNIIGGNTCNGIIILHSADNINYVEVGSIAGICGEVSDSEPYSFLHTDPVPNQFNYYKLNLGGQGFTTPLEVLFYKTGEDGFTIYPNPSTEYFNLYVSAVYQDASIEVFDSNGKIILIQSVPSGELIQIFTQDWSGGNYVIRIKDGDSTVGNDRHVHL